MKILFNKNLKEDILKSFNKGVDKEGYIVDRKSKERVLSIDGVIKYEEFAGVAPGSEMYLKSDIISLIKYLERKKNDK